MRPERLNEEHDRELAYLRRQLDEVGAENLVLSQRAQIARTELEVRRRGFSLLANLGQTLGAHTDLQPALASVLPTVEAQLRVQRTMALRRAGDSYEPFAWTGFPAEDATGLTHRRIAFSEEVVGNWGLVATVDAPGRGWVREAREALGVPAFVAVPVAQECLLAVGRPAERAGFYPRFDDVDLDTMRAVGELVAASVHNARLAALSEIRRFLPPSVVQEVMNGRLGRQGGQERREVTLLAADMVGFTRLAERIPADVLAEVLNAYLRDMTALAHAHKGTVGSLAGDGVLVIFGAPEEMTAEQQGEAAAQAAFAMRARMPLLAAEARARAGELALDLRIGLHTGRCAVGVFGSDTQRTYTAIGMPVNLAARLESSAAPGEVLTSGRTLALLGERVRARPRGRLSLKGIADPVHAHSIEPA